MHCNLHSTRLQFTAALSSSSPHLYAPSSLRLPPLHIAGRHHSRSRIRDGIMPGGVGRPRRGSNKEQTAAANKSGMEEEMAGMSLSDFEFFKILLPGMYEEALRLPTKFVRVLGACRDLKLRLAGPGMPLWDVEVFADEKRGDMYLAQGWKKFARAHDLRDGYLLVFRYDNDPTPTLTLTVFDRTTCRKPYVHAAAAAARGARRQLAISEPSQFTVSLRQCNLAAKQNQYLNVPVDFQDAHGYARRRRVELRMGGKAWSVNLKRGRRALGDRTALKYGWHQFCVDNGLEVGDTCFFKVIREGPCVDDDEEEWEDEWEDDEHVLQVEVRKKDGTMLT